MAYLYFSTIKIPSLATEGWEGEGYHKTHIFHNSQEI